MKAWFFNDLNCTQYLRNDSPVFKGQVPIRLIEVGYGPSLEHYFGYQSSPGYPGICGLIGGHLKPEELSLQVGQDYPQIIFAPNPPVGRQSLGSALADALRHPEMGADTGLLIDLDCAEELIPWMGAADSFGMLYDLSAAPDEMLLTTVRGLTDSGLIDSERWSGLFVFDSRDASLESLELPQIKRLGLDRIQGVSILN